MEHWLCAVTRNTRDFVRAGFPLLTLWAQVT